MINPDAGDLGAKVGFVFAGLGIPLIILFYFFIPETKGLSFEEVSLLICDLYAWATTKYCPRLTCFSQSRLVVVVSSQLSRPTDWNLGIY